MDAFLAPTTGGGVTDLETVKIKNRDFGPGVVTKENEAKFVDFCAQLDCLVPLDKSHVTKKFFGAAIKGHMANANAFCDVLMGTSRPSVYEVWRAYRYSKLLSAEQRKTIEVEEEQDDGDIKLVKRSVPLPPQEVMKMTDSDHITFTLRSDMARVINLFVFHQCQNRGRNVVLHITRMAESSADPRWPDMFMKIIRPDVRKDAEQGRPDEKLIDYVAWTTDERQALINAMEKENDVVVNPGALQRATDRENQRAAESRGEAQYEPAPDVQTHSRGPTALSQESRPHTPPGGVQPGG